uniref:Kinesin-like protein n=1 Tax=Parastrongyloides trichosuri TaxID=131310 RepID=A0A0N4Z1Q7_PARTI
MVNLTAHNSLEVVCRLRPSSSTKTEIEDSVIFVDEEHVQLNAPPDVKNLKSNKNLYKFGFVFDPYEEQKTIFQRTCLDLIEKFLQGENSLLFTYGVSGSGKTYTMTGNYEDPGILPRLADVLFNSLPNVAAKCIFKNEGKNNIKIQEVNEYIKDFKELTKTQKYINMIKDSELYFNRIIDITKLKTFDEDKIATVFVSYVELYNQYVYDLLDDDSSVRKEVKLGPNGVAIIENVVEIEVSSSKEIMAIFEKAQVKRRTAETALNSTSSRSHSIFMIRLVMTDLNDNETYPVMNNNKIVQSKIFLVDLAGSERAKRSNAEGERLTEANAINNSLLTLRKCFNALKYNQRKKNKVVVPYRENKLTTLFKTFFEGSGYIRMIICVNPSVEDYDENVQVLSFAQSSQEVNIHVDTKMEKTYNSIGGEFHFPRRFIRKWFNDANRTFEDKAYGLKDFLVSRLNTDIWKACSDLRNEILTNNCYRDLLLLKLDDSKNQLESVKKALNESKERINSLYITKDKLKILSYNKY